ncbi:MAG: DUF1275 domain-containing protein, partial [Bacteroidetes bacterium]|nr:DUF1275 domain-containing protein [Bacteroidota bacterium]
LAFMVLTTNVTGHAALLALRLTQGDFRSVRMVGLWLLLFLAGAFLSGLYIIKTGRNRAFAYTVPLLVEVLILCFVGAFGFTYDNSIVRTEYFAGSLLFAMGMQNALVSMISGSVVRTTHLTGMFTDLGIELSAMLTSGERYRAALKRKIVLRVTIISFFLLGGIVGGYAFVQLRYHAFFIPVSFLLIALLYDYFRVRFLRLHSRIRQSRE